MPKINFFCEASFKHGLGHLMRQIHIANEFRRQKKEVRFFIPGYQTAKDILKQYNFSYHTVENFDSVPNMEKEDGGITILDIQNTTFTFIQTLKNKCKKIISFEDHGEGRNSVDLLIDCNLNPENSQKISSPANILFGLPYSVLGPQFRKFHLEQRNFQDEIRSLLITFGGTDPYNITLDLAKHIPNKLKTTIIVGPGFQNQKNLMELNNNQINIKENAGDMAQMLVNHDGVFCSGGITLHEAMCLGTPAFVINQVEHQEDKAKTAESRGAAINLGQTNTWNKNRLTEIFNLNNKILSKMSDAGKKCIDGQGLNRVTEAILSTY
tara:strand:+ start:1929 stop:2900 length:972 start_codon:yes stop_codon:yes gene_type:complete